MLHKETDLFKKIVIESSQKYSIATEIIEKDYYVTLFLKEILKRQPNIIFRGGTSLSKCYHIINRFSEDIDLSLDGDKPTEGERRNLVYTVKEIINDFGFRLNNPTSIYSKREFNSFKIGINSIYKTNYIKPDLIVETAVFLQPYPNITKQVSSYVYEYLKSINREDIIEKYGLEPFELKVQSLERTFVDKIFALCDYYLDGRITEHSRHLYDLYKMRNYVKIDSSLLKLFNLVREDRKAHKICLSAQDGIDINACLQEIIDKDIYKQDYETITKPLIFEDVSYETVKTNLQEIINQASA